MENLVTCPYNKFHQIRNSRIRYHIIKCQKNNPHINLLVCPYNATHRFREEEEKNHLVDCADRRIYDIQRYNEPVPGRHGYLVNPPFFGSSRKFEVEEPIPGDEQAIANTGQPVQNEQNPHVPIRTSQRIEDLRDRVDHLRLSREGRQLHSTMDSSRTSMRASLGATSNATSTVKAPTYRPLRRPFTQGGPPSVARSPSPFESNFPGRRRSPSSGRRSLRSLSPASTIRSCTPSPVRQDRKSPVRQDRKSPVRQDRNPEGLPSGLTLEGGRLVPRKRSTSPYGSSRGTPRSDGFKRT